MSEVIFDDKMYAELIHAAPNEKFIAGAARVSTGKAMADMNEELTDRDKGLIRRLWLDGHTVPFEMCNAIFRMGHPIFVDNQLKKHRISSQNTMSGRYTEFEPRFYIPDEARLIFQEGKAMDYNLVEDGEGWEWRKHRLFLMDDMDTFCTKWYATYQTRIRNGIAKEVARMDMPLNTYTWCWVNMNLHSWLNFLSLRINDPERGFYSHAQAEINESANLVAKALEQKFPTVMSAFYEKMEG